MNRYWVAGALVAALCCAGRAGAGQTATFSQCLKGATTQTQVNDCARSSLKSTDTELRRVYRQLLSIYKDDPAFIKRLKQSQRRWRQSRAADFALMYPGAGEPNHHGSALATCTARLKERLARRRIAFLRQWLHGAQNGDLCAGSRKMQFQLEQGR